MARPKGSTYTPEIGDEILGMMGEGMSLRTVCEHEGMPCMATIFNWLRQHPDFLENYKVAIDTRADVFGEDILAIADDTVRDTHTTTYADGVERVSANTEWISRSRLRVDARKWLMSKHNPKKYGDKIVNENTGPNGGPIPFQWLKPE